MGAGSGAVRWSARGLAEVPAPGAWLSPSEAAWSGRMRYPKRRTEYLVSRWTAKHALATVFGLDAEPATLARIEVRPRPTGAPMACLDGAPLPISISSTDRADWAVCTLGDPSLGLGCDLELVEPRTAGFVRDYFRPAEVAAVVAAGPEQHDLMANLIWSAKESALKVLQTGLRRDTRSVEVTLAGWPAVDPAPPPADGAVGGAPDRRSDGAVDGWPDRPSDRTVSPSDGAVGGWRRLTVRPVEGGEFPGWWCRFGPFLLTVATTAETAAPASRDDPPGLTTAIPSHSWLAQSPEGSCRPRSSPPQ